MSSLRLNRISELPTTNPASCNKERENIFVRIFAL